MRLLLPLLFVLCAAPVDNIFQGTCLRKAPPPGVLVLPPGSNLVLSCSGDVMVDGAKIITAGRRSNTNRGRKSSGEASTTVNVIRTSTVENRLSHGRHTEAVTREDKHLEYTGYTSSPSPATVQSATGEAEEEGGEEGSRSTRGERSRPEWKLNRRRVGRGHGELGGIQSEGEGASLSLPSVTLKDSGNYTCHLGGRQRVSLKVIIADPPEKPSLSCYKKSPSSKIRCEWTPQKPVTTRPDCSLFLTKSPRQSFIRYQCSYSSLTSRCWCALDHDEEEQRTHHMAYLCVTSIAGNATSDIKSFMPLNILKPDPPSAVSVQQEEGQERKMTVTWSFPDTWKSQDRYYELIYEMKYQPSTSSFSNEQMMLIKGRRSYTITDAMPGVQYLIYLRAKDEFDGQWSDWSRPVNASSWMDSRADLVTTTFPPYEGSGLEDDTSEVLESEQSPVAVSHPILWICGSFAVLAVILSAYVFRHKDRLMSKLQILNIVTECGNSTQPPPPAPVTPEGQALVTFAPPSYKGEEGEEENEEEEQMTIETTEGMHFNNTSYFLVQRE